jgi:hypothetical protein
LQESDAWNQRLVCPDNVIIQYADFDFVVAGATTCSQICNQGSIPLVYTFPTPAADGNCVLANIPSSFGAVAGDFFIQVTCTFNSLTFNNLGTILENGITNVINPHLGIYVLNGKLSTFIVSGGNILLLETSNVPLGIQVTIRVSRHRGTCSMLVEGTVVASTPCSNSALFPSPSNDNIWTIIGVGAQKNSGTSCANQINAFTAAMGRIHAVKLIGGDLSKKIVRHLWLDMALILAFSTGADTCSACPAGTYTGYCQVSQYLCTYLIVYVRGW